LKEPILVIPCSGIGKVHGLLSREAAYLVVDELAADQADVVCLALLVKGDEETLARVRRRPTLTLDGCGKACAQKNVELAGGQVAKAFQVGRFLAGHRGSQPGTGSELTEEGWLVARELASEAAAEVRRLVGPAATHASAAAPAAAGAAASPGPAEGSLSKAGVP
jgi:uncharacterized metal-binding protein